MIGSGFLSTVSRLNFSVKQNKSGTHTTILTYIHHVIQSVPEVTRKPRYNAIRLTHPQAVLYIPRHPVSACSDQKTVM